MSLKERIRSYLARLRRPLPKKVITLSVIEQFMHDGKFNQALVAIDKISTEHQDVKDQLECMVLKSKCLTQLGQFEKAIKVSQEVIQICTESMYHPHILIDIFVPLVEALWRLGRYDECLTTIEHGEEVLSTTRESAEEFIIHKTSLLRHKGNVHFLKGNFPLALEYYQQTLELNRKIGNEQQIAECLFNIGLVFFNTGDLEEALRKFQRSLPLFERMDSKTGIANVLATIGGVHHQRGNLDKGLEYHYRSLKIHETIGNLSNIALTLLHIGDIQRQKGELESALNRFKRCLEIYQKLGSKQDIAMSYTFIGRILHQKGDITQAIKHLEEGLDFYEDIGHLKDSAGVLYDLVRITTGSNAIDKANQYLERLAKINNEEDSKIIDQLCRVGEALVLKTSTNTRKRARSELLLEQVVKEDIIQHEVTVVALLNLCDLLLDEIRISDDPTFLEALQSHLNRLLEIAQQQQSYWLLAETYWLQSQLALVLTDAKESLRLLNQAQLLAEERGLERLAMKISDEYDKLLEKSEEWEHVSGQKTVLERVQATQIGSLLTDIANKREIEITPTYDEPVQFQLIAAKAGFSLVTKKFQSGVNVDEFLVSGFVTAMASFSEEVFSQSIERMKVGKYTLLMHAEYPFIFCYVFKGQSYSAMRKMNSIIETLKEHSSLWQSLETTVNTGAVDMLTVTAVENIIADIFT